MQEQSITPTKPNGGKGWMICSIVLLVLVVGMGIFGGIIISKGNRDTNRLSEVESQLKEKENRIKELEVEEPTKDNVPELADKPAKIDINGLRKITATESGSGAMLNISKLEITDDGKYVYMIGSVGMAGTGSGGVWYKSVEAGSSWKELIRAQAAPDCSRLSSEVLDFMKNYKYIDDDLSSKYLACTQSDGSIFPE